MSERQASTFRVGQFTKAHQRALAILNREGVWFKAEEVVHIPGEYDFLNRPVSYKVDILVVDGRYGLGVVEIEGEGTNSNDSLRDCRLKKAGVEWVEHVPNKDAQNVMLYLRGHYRDV